MFIRLGKKVLNDTKAIKNCKRLFELSAVYIVPTHFRLFMLINVVTFLLLAHNRMSQGCLYNKSSISLHVGLGDWRAISLHKHCGT